MTVPTQRGEASEPTLTGVILEGIRDVKTSVDRLTGRFDNLTETFVPRREIDTRLKDVTDDIESLKRAREEAERARASARHWLIGLALTGLLGVAGLVVAVITLIETFF